MEGCQRGPPVTANLQRGQQREAPTVSAWEFPGGDREGAVEEVACDVAWVGMSRHHACPLCCVHSMRLDRALLSFVLAIHGVYLRLSQGSKHILEIQINHMMHRMNLEKKITELRSPKRGRNLERLGRLACRILNCQRRPPFNRRYTSRF